MVFRELLINLDCWFVPTPRLIPANDPRVGTGSGRTELIIQARVFQAVATKTTVRTEFRLILSKVTNTVALTDEPIAFRACRQLRLPNRL